MCPCRAGEGLVYYKTGEYAQMEGSNRAGGLLNGDMTAGLWGSAATFRRGIAEKVSFVLLNQLDLMLTVFAVSAGLSELNPFIRHLVTIPIMLLIIKCAVPLLIAWLIPGRLLLPAIILLALVVSWNVKELLLFLL